MSLASENVSEETSDRRSILVVDDEKQCDQLVDSSSDLEVSIYQAGNGEEALEIIASHVPNLVIMDIRMPILDGVGAVDKLADTDSDVKIILMTGDPTSLRAAYKRCPDVFTIIIDDSMVSILSMSNDMFARTITWTT
jgi:CheY-like chemotaxis protein